MKACAPMLLGAALVAAAAPAQIATTVAAPSLSLTLEDALEYAADHYPSVRAAQERLEATTAAAVARSAFLPRLDATWQSSLATTNNVFGQVLPQSVIPALTGPVLTSESDRGVYGSATGALLSWQPFDFGLRKATIAGADTEIAGARAGEALTRLDVQGSVGAAFLDALSRERAVVAARADLDRRDLLARSVRALVDNDLKPGAEAARADAERAAASVRLIQAEASLAVARARLARALGVSGTEVAIDGERLLSRLPDATPRAVAPAAHPLAEVRQSAIDAARAREITVARADLPKVYLQSSVFARGSGASPDGVLDTSTDGLGLDRDNWALGVQILFPNLFALSSLRARKAVAEASLNEADARYDEALLEIASARDEAAVMAVAARAVAAATPVELDAARQSEAQARARYQAGLTNLVEVADAQSLLAHAEAQDELARIDVWRATLAMAVAEGDLAPFLAALRSSPESR